MTEQFWKVMWKNSIGKDLELTHLKEHEAKKYQEGFKSEGKESIICQM